MTEDVEKRRVHDSNCHSPVARSFTQIIAFLWLRRKPTRGAVRSSEQTVQPLPLRASGGLGFWIHSGRAAGRGLASCLSLPGTGGFQNIEGGKTLERADLTPYPVVTSQAVSAVSAEIDHESMTRKSACAAETTSMVVRLVTTVADACTASAC
jgi:hypothetical protein